MRVLVVEDEWLVREMAVEMLKEAGFQVVEAATAEEAVLRCDEQMADVLFTDIRLPGKLTGWDVAEHCRATHPHVPGIYATGYTEGACRQVAGSVFFRKPYRAEQVIQAIRELTC